MSTRSRLTLFVFLLVLPVLSITTAPVYACSCAPPPPPAEALEQATAVFAGTVTHIDVPGGDVISTADPVAVTFAVETVWKGPVEPILLVTTARSSISCGYHFDLNQSYLVYAYGSEGNLETGLCSRTTRLSPILDDLAVLGEGTTPPALAAETSGFPSYSLLALVVLGILVIIGLAVQRWRT
jgi:hypothetical protein